MDNLLTGAPLFYPKAKQWMWDYCIYLGPYTDSEGENYDLGIWMGRSGKMPSAAIVYGNEPGMYISGELNVFGKDESWSYYEHYEVVRFRARALGLIQ